MFLTIKRTTYYFEKPGEENTEELLKIVKETALEHGIEYVVVASTRGVTGAKATEVFKGTDIKLVIVTHQTGYREPGVQLLTEENRKRLEEAGARVVTGTDILTGGVDIGISRRRSRADAVAARLPPIPPPVPTIIANILRLFCQGVKVCVEIAMMAADCGAVPLDKPIISVAGSHVGADTALLITPASSNRMLNLKIHEILAKPL